MTLIPNEDIDYLVQLFVRSGVQIGSKALGTETDACTQCGADARNSLAMSNRAHDFRMTIWKWGELRYRDGQRDALVRAIQAFGGYHRLSPIDQHCQDTRTEIKELLAKL